jgi:[methyl-Co(III) methanol-specific corrinoid protein]:coenzyme M methyltransferase
MPATSRADVFNLLAGRRPARAPCFSGLITVTQPGLEALGLPFSSIHADPAGLAAAAASPYRLAGFESAVLPCDLCVEAEALGAVIDFRAGEPRPELPRVLQTVAASAADVRPGSATSLMRRGRLPIVAEALARLKDDIGAEIVVGAFVPGPLTLAMHVVDPGPLLLELTETPDMVGALLDHLTPVLIEVGRLYHASGADFLTVHEMGGSPGFIGPRPFERLVLPRLQRLLAALPPPRVLSVCGRTNRGLPLLAAAGADALSVDQTNDLAASRTALGPQPLLFGNLDPVAVLAEGTPEQVRAAVSAARAAGADAIWPGCDLFPQTPTANLQAMVAAASEGKKRPDERGADGTSAPRSSGSH